MTATRPEETSLEGSEQPILETWIDDLDRTLDALSQNNIADHPVAEGTSGRQYPESLQPPATEDPETLIYGAEIATHSPSYSPQRTSTSRLTEALITPNTLFIARLIGYGLMMMGFIDLLYILIPPQLANPVWEYQAIGDIVKLVPVPILALLLVFAGEKSTRHKLELKLLTVLSWLTLVISILFFLLLPLIVTNSFKIDRFNNTQITTEVKQQKQKLDATQKQVQNMDGEQLKFFIPTPDKIGSLGSLPNSPAQAKTSISANLERAKAKADAQAAEARKNVTANLVKNTFRLFAEALIAGVIFLMFWSRTDWARQRSVRRSAPGVPSATSVSSGKSGGKSNGKAKKQRFR